MTGTRTSCIFLIIYVGIGSREQDFDGILARSLATLEQLTSWREVTEAVSGSKNIRRCSSRRSGPDVLDFTLENVTKSCTVRVKADVVGFAGGDSSLLTLDHSARVSCLDSEITHLQSSAYIVFGLEQ